MGVKISEFINFDEACEILGIKDFEILDYLRRGLQPYSEYQKLFVCPDKFHQLKYYRHRIREKALSRIIFDIRNFETHSKNIDSEWIQTFSEEEITKLENKISKLEADGHDLNSWEYLRDNLSDSDIGELIIRLKEGYFLFEEVNKYKYPDTTAKETDDRVNLMYKMAGPQFEKLYSITRNKFGYLFNADIKEIREFVISNYKKDRDAFNFIKLDYLKDKWLYQVRRGQAKKDFIGRLFKKTSQDMNLGENDAQELYDGYVDYKKSTKVD